MTLACADRAGVYTLVVIIIFLGVVLWGFLLSFIFSR